MSVSCSWTASAGSINSGGMYSAPGSGSGTASVRAASGSVTGSAGITYSSIPAAPTNLTATAVSSRQVTLSWTAGGTNQTGFVVQRSTASNSWSTIATVGTTTTTYSDTTVNKHKTYSYRIYAYNSSGNSPYSNTVTVTTPSVGVAIPNVAFASAANSSTASSSNVGMLLGTPSLWDDLYWKRFGILSTAH
jgi:hypothetical protein